MKNTTPFFPGFHRLLFGRTRRSPQQQLQGQVLALKQATLCQLGEVCAPWVPARLLKPPARGAHSRRRLFPQGLTFWAFLSQVLSPESPCRETVRKVQAWYISHRQSRPGSGTAAYCRARSRLSHDTLLDIHRHTAVELQRRVTREQLWGEQGVSPRFLDFSQAFGATGSILYLGCSLSVARPWIPTSDDPSARLR